MKKLFLIASFILLAQCSLVFGQTTYDYTGSVQTYTVPCGVNTVTITSFGAAGGGGSSNDGGLGAEIIGTFTVTPGDVLDVMVGQQGLSNNEGSGGGGSFVWNTSGNVLMVAAGGGGGGYQGGAGGNGSGSAATNLGTGPQGSVAGGSGGNGGPGGTCSSSYAAGGGGAGWFSNGGIGSSCGGYGGGGGGNTPLSGGIGGLADASNFCGYASNGGYGGGGASTCYASGGGGGYNGGGGAIGFQFGGNGGGGGSSFNGGTSQSNSSGIEVTDGQVIISTSYIVLSVTAPDSFELCNGTAIASSTAEATGGTGAYNYSWAPTGGNAATASNLTAGTYTITVTDGIGCSATAMATITEPTALFTIIGLIGNELCNGDKIGGISTTPSGGTGAYTYLWSDGAAQTNANASGLTAGTYTITLTDANGCSTTASASVTQPAVLFVNFGSLTAVSCNGGSDGSAGVIPSGGTGPYNYSWSDANSQTVATATGLTAGSYTVTVTDANGCSSSAGTFVKEPAVITIGTSSVDLLCNGASNGSISASPTGGTGAFTYSWSDANTQTVATATGLTAGKYKVTVLDANGCSATATVILTEPTALTLSGLATDTLICKGNCTDVNATAGGGTPGYAYLWNTGATTTTVNVCPIVKTTYTVTLTDANGCTDNTTVTVDVSSCLGINEVGSIEDQVKFYPNPFSQSVNINVSISGPVSITIFNMVGENVGTWQMDKGLNTINTSNIAQGIYTVQVKTPNGIWTKKLVKVN